MKHRIKLLLSCTCIIDEPLEAAIFIPLQGDKRTCDKHGDVTVKKVDYPYWVDDEETEQTKSPS